MTAGNGHGRAVTLDDFREIVVPAARRLSDAWSAVPLPKPSVPSLHLPSLKEVQRQAPMKAMMATGELASALRELTGRDVVDLETMQDLIGFAYRARQIREQHRKGEFSVDEFGFDREWTESLVPIFRILYRRYWRVETHGVSVVPRTGGALLVSNHAGVLPLDGSMIKLAVFDATDRHARALIAGWFGSLPALSWFLRRTGQTLGHPADSDRLLQRGELVLVFPEGVNGTGKPWSERYRLRRFGRGGFVSTAIRSRVPVIPISVVGSEETYPMLANLKPLADLLGFPYFPLTPTWPWLGPLGLIPLPSKWSIQFHEPIRTDDLPLSAANDAARIAQISDQVRETIQQGLVRGLEARVRTFRG